MSVLIRERGVPSIRRHWDQLKGQGVGVDVGGVGRRDVDEANEGEGERMHPKLDAGRLVQVVRQSTKKGRTVDWLT